MYRLLKAFNGKANEVVKILVIVSLMAMTLVCFLQVIFRYFLKNSLSWSEELARYFFIWLTFIGASLAAREGAHINVTAFLSLVKNKTAKKIALMLPNILSIFFLAVLIRWGVPIAYRVILLKQISPSMPFLYIGVVYLAIPIGSFLMLLNILENSIDLWLNKNQQEKVG